MNVTIVQENKRLDEIIFAHYGSLEYFDEVVAKNEAISTKTILDIGDVVFLPEFETKSVKKIEVKALWD